MDLWPITQPGQSTVLGDLAVPLGTTEETSVSFAKSLLGWRDAVVTDREPSVVLFRNADGTPSSAWGTALRSGDFAAG